MIEVKFLQVGIDVNKTSALSELIMSMNPNNIAFLKAIIVVLLMKLTIVRPWVY